MESYAGRLLVATPALGDPNFDRAVVLVLRHDGEEGAVGLILNRPSATPVGEVLAPWGPVAADPDVVFVGGPVGPGTGFGVALARPGAVPVTSWEPVTGRIGVVDLTAEPDPAVEAVRVFTQYAGWGAGQIESEVALGAWFAVDAQPGDVVSPDPDGLWRAVLRRQPGKLAWYANHPADPSLN